VVDDIIMPPIGLATGGIDFSNIFVALNGPHYESLAQARAAGAPTTNIGVFINRVDHSYRRLIVAVALFMVIKAAPCRAGARKGAPALARRSATLW
jgi:large conductance mechanosensitive channel